MTEIEKLAHKFYPVDNTPLGDDNAGYRNAYIKGAKEVASTMYAKIKVVLYNYVGNDLDKQISLATLVDKLDSLADYCHDLYNEPDEE